MEPYLTQLDEIRKTTSIFLKMEDDLKIFLMEDDFNFLFENEIRPTFLEMEDDLNFFENGRRPQYFWEM